MNEHCKPGALLPKVVTDWQSKSCACGGRWWSHDEGDGCWMHSDAYDPNGLVSEMVLIQPDGSVAPLQWVSPA